MNLLDALKTSFSHRSLAARSIGKKDSVSDFAIASIAMMKSYVRTTGNNDEKCMEKYVCEANTECNKDIGGNSIFCQLGRWLYIQIYAYQFYFIIIIQFCRKKNGFRPIFDFFFLASN